MTFLGEHVPELAQKVGLDVSKLSKDAEYAGKLAIVTFRNPHSDAGGRRDPIADLPPSYSRFGIVDRDHKDHVQVGETWIVQPYSPEASAAVFLVPVCEVDLASVLALDLEKTKELAGELVENRPDLVRALGDLLPTQSEPRADPEELRQLRSALRAADDALGAARRALEQARGAVTTGIDEALAGVLDAQAGVSGVPPAQGEVKLVRKAKEVVRPLFLADANLFINAERWKRPECNRILDAAGSRFRLGTTRAVYEELKHSYRLPQELEVIEIGEIDARLRELAEVNASATGKKAGANDLSLVQALLENEGIRGIITEDPDIGNMHPASVVKEWVGREVECLTATEFGERHRKLVPLH